MADKIELIEVSLQEIQACEGPGAQIMILGEVVGNRRFPIFIGFNEMDALDRALHGKATSRPLTHDLVLNAIDTMHGTLVRVLIDDLHEDTFFGKLVVRLPEGEEVMIDSRPSDAIVLAARRGVPIFAAEKVLDIIAQHQSDDDFE